MRLTIFILISLIAFTQQTKLKNKSKLRLKSRFKAKNKNEIKSADKIINDNNDARELQSFKLLSNQGDFLRRMSEKKRQQQKLDSRRLATAPEKDDGKDKKEANPMMELLKPYYKNLYKFLGEMQAADKNNTALQEQKEASKGEKPDYFPSFMRGESEEVKAKKLKAANTAKYLQYQYRFCIYPQSTPNIYEICEQEQIAGSEDKPKKKVSYKTQACKHYNCLNCCANMKTIYQMLILKHQDQAAQFGLLVEGYKEFTEVVDSLVPTDLVEKCEKACRKVYKFEEPVLNDNKPKETKIGLTSNSPAYHCKDIKDNNKAVSASGLFYTKPEHSKTISKVYCDMESEGGGWQLLYSYRHAKNQKDFALDGTAYPLDPIYGESHITLTQAGYSFNEISEIRFFCVTSNQNKFVHFISKNSKVIMTAFDEDATQVSKDDWGSDLESLSNPSLDDTFVKLFSGKQEALGSEYTQSDILKKVTKTQESNNKGGFLDAPFASKTASWNINVKKKIFECGDKLIPTSGNKNEVLYQVWFRGRTVTKEQIKNREPSKQE